MLEYIVNNSYVDLTVIRLQVSRWLLGCKLASVYLLITP